MSYNEMFNEPILNQGNIVLAIEGHADDLMRVSSDGQMKSVTLLHLGKTDPRFDHQPPSVDITITSVDVVRCSHELIDRMCGHKVRATFEIID